MNVAVWFIMLVFVLADGTPGVHTNFLRTQNDCDVAAASMIEKDLKDYPDATDFGYVCGPLELEGYAPSLFGKELPEGHPPIEVPQPVPKQGI